MKLLVLFTLVVYVNTSYDAFIKKRQRLEQNIRADLHIAPSTNTNNHCKLEAWNNVTTYTLPLEEKHKKWRKECRNCMGVMLNDGEMRLVSAFVYPDYIAVVTSLLGKKNNGRQVYCHYYDCNRNLIATFESILFPVAAVRCVRRAGAEYISVTLEATDEPPEPIPIVNRVESEPKYEIGVCVGEIYGNQTRWMDTVEFIEHHRLIGASFFYVTIFNSDEKTTRLILDYQRLGLLEPTWVNLEIKHVSWQFHMIQVADCFYRSRMHSRWTINIDHDERFIMRNPLSLAELLQSLPESVAGLSFPVARILVEDDALPKNATYFETYRNTTLPLWQNLKSIYRHEHSHVPFYHFPWRIDTGYRILTLNSTVGYFRHYRYTSGNYFAGGWQVNEQGLIEKNELNWEFELELRSRIEGRIKYLFDQRYIRCEEVESEFFPFFKIRDKCVFDNGTTINI